MSEEEKGESIDVDSISWGSASKDSVRKVYGNVSINPLDMAKKIEIINVMSRLALNQIESAETMKTVQDIQLKYGGNK